MGTKVGNNPGIFLRAVPSGKNETSHAQFLPLTGGS